MKITRGFAALVAVGFVACGKGDDGENPHADAGDDVASDADAGGDAPADGSGMGDLPPDAPDTADATDTTDTAELPEGPLACTGTVTASVTPTAGGSLELAVTNSAVPVSLEFLGREVSASTDVTLSCEGLDIAPDGYFALSPSFRVSTDPDGQRFGRRYFVTVPFDLSAFPDNARPSALRVFFRAPSGTETTQPMVVNVQENMLRGNLRFESELTGTFQVGVSEHAGETYMRDWKFRAVGGISMGASGASMLGMSRPEMFDIVAPLGGPTDWQYLVHYIRDGGMGGFAPAPEFGPGPLMTPTLEWEHPQRYDEWYFPTGEGTGGSFNREDYSQIFHDLMLGFGNMVMYNPDSPYAMPGLPLEQLLRTADDRCPPTDGEAWYTIETGFFDDEYNPDGSLPVIAFCDGRGSRNRSIPFDRACDIDGVSGPDESNEGLYDDPSAQDYPVEITWAVDVNGNGQRDPSEPVLRNFWEPYEDVGTDGLASADEAGFDPASHPDPAGDDYDPKNNPFGTEGNWLHEEGEPWEDFGLDGVEDSPQFGDGGFDWGEGNGTFDYNPNVAYLLFEKNPRHRMTEVPAETWDHLTWYMDAGIRDLFNFAVGSDTLIGTLQGLGQNVRIYDDFYAVEDLPGDLRDEYNFNNVDYANVGEHVYVRYGNPEADEESICFGNGKHVGTVSEVTNRLLTMLAFTLNRFPDGEFSTLAPPYPLPNGSYYAPSPSTGGRIKYSVVLPPGYERTQCTDGIDNDLDGQEDGFDLDCESAESTSEAGEASVHRCNDGLDNDDDRLSDSADPDCADGDGRSEAPLGSPSREATYPTVYVLHGYGMTPDDLQVTALPFAGFMAGGFWAKAIIIYADGFCGEIEQTQCNDGTDNDSDGLSDRDDPDCGSSGGRAEDGTRPTWCDDGIDNDYDGLVDTDDGGCGSADWDSEQNCVQGNFYTDHQAWPDGRDGGPQYENEFFELVDHIDSTYRVRAPEQFEEIRD